MNINMSNFQVANFQVGGKKHESGASLPFGSPRCRSFGIGINNPRYIEDDKENHQHNSLVKPSMFHGACERTDTVGCRPSGSVVDQLAVKLGLPGWSRSVLVELNGDPSSPFIEKKTRAHVKERKEKAFDGDYLSQTWQWREASEDSPRVSDTVDCTWSDDDDDSECVERVEGEGWEEVRRRLAFSDIGGDENDHQDVLEGLEDLSHTEFVQVSEWDLEEAAGSSGEFEDKVNRPSDHQHSPEMFLTIACFCGHCLLCYQTSSRQEVVHESHQRWDSLNAESCEKKKRVRKGDDNVCRYRCMQKKTRQGDMEVDDGDDMGNDGSEAEDLIENGEEESDAETDDEGSQNEEDDEGSSDDEIDGQQQEEADESEDEEDEIGEEGGEREEEEGGDEEEDEEVDDEGGDDEGDGSEDEADDAEEEDEKQAQQQHKSKISATSSIQEANSSRLVEDASNSSKFDPKKILVGGMPYSTTEEDIHSFFAECGTIADVDCANFSDSGRFRGMAFITFKTVSAAKKALSYDGCDMGGRYLKIQPYRLKGASKDSQKSESYKAPPPKTAGCLTAYIGNLSWDIDEDTVRSFLKDCKIRAVRFVEDKNTGEFKGFGHVDFEDESSLDRAVSKDQEKVLGRPMKIAYAVVRQKGGEGGKASSASGKEDANMSQKNDSPKRKKGCFECGDEGHKSFNCPQRGKSNKRPRNS